MYFYFGKCQTNVNQPLSKLTFEFKTAFLYFCPFLLKQKSQIIRNYLIKGVPLTPKQCRYILDNYPVQIKVQKSSGRCYTNAEYEAENIALVDDVDDCEVLMGVKEVPIAQLISDKTYFYFSHTIKKQAYNRDLLRAMLEKNIRMIDYETLTRVSWARIMA